jgi:hypothetical protein
VSRTRRCPAMLAAKFGYLLAFDVLRPQRQKQTLLIIG